MHSPLRGFSHVCPDRPLSTHCGHSAEPSAWRKDHFHLTRLASTFRKGGLMDFRRSEWLILCGLGVAALALNRGNNPFRERSGVSDWKRRVDDYLAARAAARQARRRRSADRRKMMERPDVKTAWLQLAHDRFSSSPRDCNLIVETIGKGHTRGITPFSVEDPVTGDHVRMTYGDYGDRVMMGTVRVGGDGEPVKFHLALSEEAGGPLYVVEFNYYQSLSRRTAPPSPPFVNDDAMKVLARLFNCRARGFNWVGTAGKRSFLTGVKSAIMGPRITSNISWTGMCFSTDM